MEKECLIYYVGKRGILNSYDAQLQELGFTYARHLQLRAIDKDIAVYRYSGHDWEADISRALSMDRRIRIEPCTGVSVLLEDIVDDKTGKQDTDRNPNVK
jgi:hypothetical protein